MSLVRVIAYRKHTLHLRRLLYIFLIWMTMFESVPNPELTVTCCFFSEKKYGAKTMNDFDFNWMFLKKGPGVLENQKIHRMFYSKVPKSSHGAQVSWMIWRSLGKVNDSNCGDWVERFVPEALKGSHEKYVSGIHGCPVHWITERLGNPWQSLISLAILAPLNFVCFFKISVCCACCRC